MNQVLYKIRNMYIDNEVMIIAVVMSVLVWLAIFQFIPAPRPV